MRKVEGVSAGSHRYYYELNQRLFDTPNRWFKVEAG